MALSPEEQTLFEQLSMKARSGAQPMAAGQPAPTGQTLDPDTAIQQIAAKMAGGPTLNRNKTGQLVNKVPVDQPLLRLFGMKKEVPVNSVNYLKTLEGALGPERTKQLLPGELPQTPEGEAFVPRTQFDQIMEAARVKGTDSRMLSPEESKLTIEYWKTAAPSLVPMAESIIAAQGGLPEWLGKQGPSYRLKRSELGSVQGFTEDNEPVEYDSTEKKWYVGGKETPADKVGRFMSKTRPQMSGEQINEVTNLLNAKNQLNRVNELFDASATGPVESRILGFQELTGIQMPDMQGLSALTDSKVKLRTVLSSAINDYIKAITGAQMSEPEARRIMKALPKAGSADEAFIPTLQEIMKVTSEKLNTRLDVLETQDTVGIRKLRELSDPVKREPVAPKTPTAGTTKSGVKFRVIK